MNYLIILIGVFVLTFLILIGLIFLIPASDNNGNEEEEENEE